MFWNVEKSWVWAEKTLKNIFLNICKVIENTFLNICNKAILYNM